MEDKFIEVLNNSINSVKYPKIINIKDIIRNIKDALKNNYDLLIDSNRIDVENNNGYKIDINKLINIVDKLLDEEMIYGLVLETKKDEYIIYQKEVMNSGIVAVINDGSPYTTLELIIRNLLLNNKTIIINNGFMSGINVHLITIIREVLKINNIDENLINYYFTNNYQFIINKRANIDLVVVVGNKDLEQLIIRESLIKVLPIGYNEYDIYLEDEEFLPIVKDILNNHVYFNILSLNELDIDSIIVNDIEEAIHYINCNSSKAGVAIFTKNKDNANQFIREIKSSHVYLNTSPIINNELNINQLDLCLIKKITVPNNEKRAYK